MCKKYIYVFRKILYNRFQNIISIKTDLKYYNDTF